MPTPNGDDWYELHKNSRNHLDWRGSSDFAPQKYQHIKNAIEKEESIGNVFYRPEFGSDILKLYGYIVEDIEQYIVSQAKEKREFEILKIRYGIGGFPIPSLREMAKTRHCTGERIRQLEARAISKVQEYVKKNYEIDTTDFTYNNGYKRTRTTGQTYYRRLQEWKSSGEFDERKIKKDIYERQRDAYN
jgi:hypothetical protein